MENEPNTSLNETVAAATAPTLSQMQTYVPKDKSHDQVSSLMMRPTSAKETIVAKGFKVGNVIENNNRLVTDDDQQMFTANSEEMTANRTQSTNADAYLKLASRTKKVFEQSLPYPQKRSSN